MYICSAKPKERKYYQQRSLIMDKQYYLDPERLSKVQHQIWNIATNHGWHEQPKSL